MKWESDLDVADQDGEKGTTWQMLESWKQVQVLNSAVVQRSGRLIVMQEWGVISWEREEVLLSERNVMMVQYCHWRRIWILLKNDVLR